MSKLTGLWSSTYRTTGQVSINGHYVRNSSTLPKQGTCFPLCGRNNLAAEQHHQYLKKKNKKYSEHVTLLLSHQGKRQSSDAKCWEQIDAQHGQILLQMPVLSNSMYKNAKHLDRAFLKIRCTLLGFKRAYLGDPTVCSLKTFVKLVFATQLKPEQDRKTKQSRDSSISTSSSPFLVSP